MAALPPHLQDKAAVLVPNDHFVLPGNATLDVHFISSLPVKQQPACMTWVDKRPAQIVGAES
jgi:hypothetical protein